LFRFETYYLYHWAMQDNTTLNEACFVPRVSGFTFKFASSNHEAGDLEAQGLEFRSQVIDARKRLDKGAVAFCIFVGQEFAHVAWIAFDQDARDSCNAPPCEVDFSNHEAYVGSTWTSPKYRGMGFDAYGSLKRRQFMLEKGVDRSRSAVPKKNIVSQKSLAKVNAAIYGEGRLIKVLWWKSWKEKPFPPER